MPRFISRIAARRQLSFFWIFAVICFSPVVSASSPIYNIRQHSGSRRRRTSTTTATKTLSSPCSRSSCINTDNIIRSQETGLQFSHVVNPYDSNNNINAAIHCSATIQPVQRSIIKTLLRGSILRISSDLSGGTPLESIKTRVTITNESPLQATRNIIKQQGILGLYTGSSSRTIEGALVGAAFMLASTVTKTNLKAIGCPSTIAALAGGFVGGMSQAIVMTPAGMIFTSLSANRAAASTNPIDKQNRETAISICRRVMAEKGIQGFYVGYGPMCLRQATNWASRATFTEIGRSVFGLSQYGVAGELMSGVFGGVCSCWNTPIETIRVMKQRDMSQDDGQNKSMIEYWNDIVAKSGYRGLFRGVTPRALQATWQTTFLIVVPNLLGV